jgi:DNA polymerase III epsilon subunit-like protein
VIGRSQHDGGVRWLKLTRAARLMGLEWPTNAHRALADAVMTGRITIRLQSKLYRLPQEPPQAVHGKLRFAV